MGGGELRVGDLRDDNPKVGDLKGGNLKVGDLKFPLSLGFLSAWGFSQPGVSLSLGFLSAWGDENRGKNCLPSVKSVRRPDSVPLSKVLTTFNGSKDVHNFPAPDFFSLSFFYPMGCYQNFWKNYQNSYQNFFYVQNLKFKFGNLYRNSTV